jgi:hypothetical protein
MKFGISAALIAFAFVGVSKCDVTVPIECPNAQEYNSCFELILKDYDSGVLDLLPFIREENPNSIYVATSGSDCSAAEKGIREASDGGCTKCTIKTELCE